MVFLREGRWVMKKVNLFIIGGVLNGIGLLWLGILGMGLWIEKIYIFYVSKELCYDWCKWKV